MSGEALQSAHCLPSPVTAIEDWLRGRARSVPARKPAQLRQLQFHCGKPPPAADPSTLIRTKTAPGQHAWRDAAPYTYRVAMYIVISKPKRMSSKDGLAHFIAISEVVFDPHGSASDDSRLAERHHYLGRRLLRSMFVKCRLTCPVNAATHTRG